MVLVRMAVGRRTAGSRYADQVVGMLAADQELGGREGLVSVVCVPAFGGGGGDDQGGQCMARERWIMRVSTVGGRDAGSALGERREHETELRGSFTLQQRQNESRARYLRLSPP